MTNDRWCELMFCNFILSLTRSELAEGWHWCPEMDGLLIGPDCWEWQDGACCYCGNTAQKESTP